MVEKLYEYEKYFKDDIEVEKGAIITEKRVKKNKELYEPIVISPFNFTRGNRATCGIIDDFCDYSSDDINEIILSLLDVDHHSLNL